MRLFALVSVLFLSGLIAHVPRSRVKRTRQRAQAKKVEPLQSPQMAITKPNKGFSLVKVHCENGWQDYGRALQIGDIDTVKKYLDDGVDLDAGIALIEVKDQVTGLMLAVYEENVEMVELLLKNHARVNVITHDHSFTALHIAAAAPNASTELCKMLLKHGADPMGLDENHLTPLFIAAANPNGQGALKAIKTHSFLNMKTLKAAVEADDTEEIIRQVVFGEIRFRGEHKLLFQLLAKFQTKELKHNDAKWVLHLAKLLVQKFPSCIDEVDEKGRSALHYASMCDPTGDIIEFLLLNGSSQKIEDVFQNRPLHYLPSTHKQFQYLSPLYAPGHPAQVLQVFMQENGNQNSLLSKLPFDVLSSVIMPYVDYNHACSIAESKEQSELEEEMVMDEILITSTAEMTASERNKKHREEGK